MHRKEVPFVNRNYRLDDKNIIEYVYIEDNKKDKSGYSLMDYPE